MTRLLLALVFVPGMLAAQGRFPPDTLRNLRVLPANIAVRDLVNTMRGFTVALGVRCPYCHVGTEGQDLSTFNFPADEKPTKATARAMIQMVQAINNQHLGPLQQRRQPAVEVTCATCHRGAPVPQALQDVIVQAAVAGGLDSVSRAYRALRERYYGRSAFDFGELTLIQAGQTLQMIRRFDEAVGVLRLNAEFHPLSAQTQTAIGDVYRANADTTRAIAAYRQALVLSPNNADARQRLREFGQQP